MEAYGTPNTSEVTSIFVDNQKFVLSIRITKVTITIIVDIMICIKYKSAFSHLYDDYKTRGYVLNNTNHFPFLDYQSRYLKLPTFRYLKLPTFRYLKLSTFRYLKLPTFKYLKLPTFGYLNHQISNF